MAKFLFFSCAVGTAAATLFANTPVQINTDDPSDFFIYFDPNVPLQTDSDVVAIHDDFFGVPWNAFMQPSPNISSMPISWLVRLNNTVNMIEAWNKPVYLALEMLTGPLRTCPAQNASDGGPTGAQVTGFAGCSQCYDFNPSTNPEASAVIDAYAYYATFYVEVVLSRLQAIGLPLVAVNFAAELNLGQRLCGDAWWNSVIAFSNSVYSVLKTQLAQLNSAHTLVFPSVQLEAVLGLQTGPDQPCVGMTGGTAPSPAIQQCIQDGLEVLAPVHRDAFAVSTYPHNAVAGYPTQKPKWQPWYLPAVLDQLLTADRQSFLIAETGYLADDLVMNLANGSVGSGMSTGVVHSTLGDPPVDCGCVLNTSTTDANTWLSYLIATAASEKKKGFTWPLLVWWSDTDLLWSSSVSSCPCTVPNQWESSCTFITAYRDIYESTGQIPWLGEIDAKAFATMGLRQVDGTPKSLWHTWQKARKSLAEEDEE
jgi:hypothetical protein